jgi:hypothetical protein
MLSKPTIKRTVEKPTIKAKRFTTSWLTKKNNTPNKIIILIIYVIITGVLRGQLC